MEPDKNVVLVTWDFTVKSEFALEHAVQASKRLKLPLGLVHIVNSESDSRKATERLKGILATKYPQLDPKPLIIIRGGNIFSTITDVADEMQARMIFMGTHGIKGMQKFFGSWALKVIAHTKVPFVVVQDHPAESMYKEIVIPVTFRSENKESTNWINYFSNHFGSNFHIFKARHTDSKFIKGIDSNIFFLRKFFSTKRIPFNMEEASGESDFVVEFLRYASKVNATAIMLMITKDIGFADYMLGAHEQYLIANEDKIPVICINPKPPKLGGSFSASGG